MKKITDAALLEKLNIVDWQEWAPVWTVKKDKSGRAPHTSVTPHDFQENHSPSRTSGLEGGSRRRILDARLWEKLSPAQQDAVCQIDRACEILTKGLGYRTSAPHLERISGGAVANANERDGERAAFYLAWARACVKEKRSHAACLDIIVFGKSCAAVDKARHVRKGWARQNLNDCLDVYCKMKGWSAA